MSIKAPITVAGGTIGWTVVPEPADAFGERCWKWSAFTPAGGTWGYEQNREQAAARAQEEFARLSE